MKEISERAKKIPISRIRNMMLQAYRKGAINLAQGSPGFDTPEHIKQAAIEAIKAGHTQYSPMIGYKELREAISKKLKTTNGIEADSETEVLVTAGAMEGLNAAILSLINPNEEAIAIGPVFPTYRNTVELAGGNLIEVPLGNNLELDLKKIRNAVTDKTKLIVINSPQNPTGRVLSKEELKGIADIAIDNDLFVVTDEIFEAVVYEGKHHSIASLPGMEDRTITINGFSKTYAMTGWRVGYLACDKELMKPINNIHTNLIICAPSISQWAALAALEGPQDCIREMVSKFKENRDLAYSKLQKLGLKCHRSQGSFYLFAETSELGKDGEQLAKELLENANVAVVPGIEFGARWKNYIRINFSKEMDELEKALEAIEKCLHGISSAGSFTHKLFIIQ